MKKILLYILIASTGIISYSCSDSLLDTKPLDKFTELDVWNDVNLAQGFIYNTYESVIPELFVNPNDRDTKMGGVSCDDYTDNVMNGKSDNIARDLIDKYFDAGWATNNSYYWYGKAPLGRKGPIKKNSFEVIRDCNLIIEKVAESKGIADVDKPALIAQGKMLRALIYFTKARLFGKYVIVDKVLTTDDELKLPRTATIKETYDFIIKDLQDAAVDLPTSAAAGKLTKGAAYAMLAEVALQGSAYIESGVQDYYQIAKKASEDLFALGYNLDADYAGLFNNYEKALTSSEIILAQYKHIDATVFSLTPVQGWMPNMEVNKTSGTPKLKESFLGWTKNWPSADMVDDYLVTDADGIAKKYDETSYYQDFMTNGGYVSKAVYGHRDSRFYASIVSDSTQLLSNTVTTRIGGNMHYLESNKGTNASTPSGYFIKKGIPDNVVGYKAVVFTNYHQSIARLGRSYLNYAEVLLRLNQPALAIEYINKTRTTHGNLPALSAGLGIDEVWKWYKIERRVELFLENDRYWSLLRWGKTDGGGVISEINNKVHKFFEIAADGKSFEIKDLPIKIAEQQKRFSTKRYLFPVPQNERDLNEKLDQNPGWE
ncbi:RagB/SusD family nutrient uptake outer membrane protein [Ancylomarina sp. 16SWW S1-10-2]|uniref:RagB/SusD family nutrient uptake outer membrane protein n=1 Tax=Ancylomarina sp. 16SWW S1-10-2 TaxID=2499681 RepID=UPI0012AE7066|nr:RagB/SusD family nutrient uptake outer membrane protein [Ancylomarina sp. 16SWW S1-10-2]MRT91990.1 RagB/SusD family nutrient uptake outer membrane protein [Ancylomarina sp. 16SWW S1-10-2]